MRCQTHTLPSVRPGSRSTVCLPHTASRSCSRRLVTRKAAAGSSNGHDNSKHDDDAFRIRGPSHEQPIKSPCPEQLERAWLEQTADGLQLADEFFTPHKGPEQQSKVFVFVRHGHSTWNEQSRIQASAAARQGTASVHDTPYPVMEGLGIVQSCCESFRGCIRGLQELNAWSAMMVTRGDSLKDRGRRRSRHS